MRMSTFFRKSRKGAAFVEYVSLIGLIGVVVIFAIVQFSGELGDSFDRTTTTISEQVDVGNPGDPDGGGPTPGGPDGDPDLPGFPTPPVPSTGVEHVFIYDTYLEYDNQTTWSYDVMAEQADIAGQFSGPPAPANWFMNVTWTGIERSSTGSFDFNEVAFTTTEYTHNIGPLPGWGPNPTSVQSCIDNSPADQQYIISGQIPNGNTIRLIVNMTPESCVPTAVYNFAENYILQHDSGVGFDYGDLANTLAAVDGITGVDFNDVPNWVLVYQDIPTGTGNEFNAISIGSNVMSINLAVTQEAYDVCNETAYMQVQLFGVLPDGDGVSLTIQVDSYTGPSPNCFVPVGP